MTGETTRITVYIGGDLAKKLITFQQQYGGGAPIYDICNELLTMALESPILTSDITIAARRSAYLETRRWAYAKLKESFESITTELDSVIAAAQEAEETAAETKTPEPHVVGEGG